MGHLLFFLVSTLGIAILSRIKEVCERVPTPSPDSLVQGPSSLECEWDTEHIGRCLVAGRVAAAAKSLQSCPTLCDPIDSSPLGSPVPGILQARTLEWVAISFSNEWKWKMKVKSLSSVRPSATPWTAAFQAPLSMGFSRPEYWSGVPLLVGLPLAFS